MDTNSFTVAGRRFRTRADYEAALRDEQKINEIKSRYSLHNGDDVRKLSDELKGGQYSFESVLGNDFDDEIFDLMEKFKSAPAPVSKSGNKTYSKKSSDNKSSDNKSSGNKSSGIKFSGNKSSDNKSNGNKTGKTNKGGSKNKVSLENYDSDMQKEILAIIRKREKRRKLIVAVFSILAAASLSYFVVYYFFAERTDQDVQALAELRDAGRNGAMPWQEVKVNKTGDVAVPDIMDEYKTLYNMNKRLIGWLKIDDTIIDYPVLQTTNNEYYLDRNFDQEYDKNGSIFMDYQCTLYPRSTNLIIYGHHMKSGKMFGSLQQFAKESYYQEHPVIQFDTIYEKGTYEIMYAFRSKVFNEDDIVFKYYQFLEANSAEEFDSNMKEMAKMSLYDTGVTANYGDQLLTLSTCDNSQSDGRFVVVAKRIS